MIDTLIYVTCRISLYDFFFITVILLRATIDPQSFKNKCHRNLRDLLVKGCLKDPNHNDSDTEALLSALIQAMEDNSPVKLRTYIPPLTIPHVWIVG